MGNALITRRGGGKPEGLYVWKKHEIGSELKEFNKSVSTLPYSFYSGCAVVLNGEIHILGSNESSCYTKHYKWNGTSWVSVSTLPYNFRNGSAVVLDGEIHILGTEDDGSTSFWRYHYKWNGSSWVSVSTLPYSFYKGSAVVLNGEIHILGSGASSAAYKYHYKWNGSSWTSVSTLPYNLYSGSAVVLDNEIHIFGGDGGLTNHYKFDGSSWTSVSTLPYQFRGGSVVVFENEMHILGGNGGLTNHYKWNGSSWVSINILPYNLYYGSAVIFDNGIHILGTSNASGYYKAHYLIIGYVPVYTFLDYIVSDKETAYPDGGEKGGYYYEKVFEITPQMFGCSKIAIDKYTPTAEGNLMTIPHSLGETPKIAILIANKNDVGEYSSSNGTHVYVFFAYMSHISDNSYPYGYDEGLYTNGTKRYGKLNPIASGSGTDKSSLNETEVIFVFQYTNKNLDYYGYYKKGVEYTLITMA